jgi:hypothetical protein
MASGPTSRVGCIVPRSRRVRRPGRKPSSIAFKVVYQFHGQTKRSHIFYTPAAALEFYRSVTDKGWGQGAELVHLRLEVTRLKWKQVDNPQGLLNGIMQGQKLVTDGFRAWTE